MFLYPSCRFHGFDLRLSLPRVRTTNRLFAPDKDPRPVVLRGVLYTFARRIVVLLQSTRKVIGVTDVEPPAGVLKYVDVEHD